MRIAYIITRSDRIGGAHVHVRDLALAMQRLHHEPIVLTGGQGPFTDELRAVGVPWHSLPHLGRAIHASDDLRALWEIRATLQQCRPDLASTHSSKAGWLGRLAANSLGLPVIFTVHGWAFSPGVPRVAAFAYRCAERCAAPFGSRIVTVSEFDRCLALRYRIVASHRVQTVHNGMPDVPPGLRATPGRAPVRLVMVARFEAQKDHATLLRALAPLQAQPWELDLIGDGPLMPCIRQLCGELGLADRVHFWGARNDVAMLMAGAQIGLLISNWEGFPRSILEAMRAGLPVVASDVGGVRESVENGVTGALVPRRNVAALRAALTPMLADPELRTRLGANGRAHYEKQFTLEHTLRKTLLVYRETLLAHRAAVRPRDARVSAPALPAWLYRPGKRPLPERPLAERRLPGLDPLWPAGSYARRAGELPIATAAPTSGTPWQEASTSAGS